MLSRDTPWHLRAATYAEHRWFSNLVQVHELTIAWIRELNMDRAPYLMARGIHRDAAENLWMLQSLGPDTKLDSFLDETDPTDVLARLEHTVWAAQAYTLRKLLEKTPADHRAALESSLEQAAWKLGRRAAETRWSELQPQQRSDLRSLIHLFEDIPFYAPMNGEAVLLRRALRAEARVELLRCAHQLPIFEVAAVADELCSVHAHWARGFAYGLNQRSMMERISPGTVARRCELHWLLIENPA